MSGQEVVDQIQQYIKQIDGLYNLLVEINRDLQQPEAITSGGKRMILNKFNEVSLDIRDEYGRWDGLLDALQVKKSHIFEPMVSSSEGSSVTAQKSAATLRFSENYGNVNEAIEEATAIRSRLKALVGYCDQLGFIMNIFFKEH